MAHVVKPAVAALLTFLLALFDDLLHLQLTHLALLLQHLALLFLQLGPLGGHLLLHEYRDLHDGRVHLLDLASGRVLLVHLGMSGSLRVLPMDEPSGKHDHLDLCLDSGQILRLHDPRRFGSVPSSTTVHSGEATCSPRRPLKVEVPLRLKSPSRP